MSSSITSPETHHFGYAAWLTNCQGRILVPNAGVTGRYCHTQVLLGTQRIKLRCQACSCALTLAPPHPSTTLLQLNYSHQVMFSMSDLLKTFPLSSSTQLILVISTLKQNPLFFSSLHFFPLSVIDLNVGKSLKNLYLNNHFFFLLANSPHLFLVELRLHLQHQVIIFYHCRFLLSQSPYSITLQMLHATCQPQPFQIYQSPEL